MSCNVGLRAVEQRSPACSVLGSAVPGIESIDHAKRCWPRLAELVRVAVPSSVVQADAAWAVLHLAATMEVRPTDWEGGLDIQMKCCYLNMQWYFG